MTDAATPAISAPVWLSRQQKLQLRHTRSRLEAVAADADLVNRLMWLGWKGPEWSKFERALVEYGVAVFRVWVHNGQVFAQCRKKRVSLPPVKIPQDEAWGLADETVANALPAFRDKVLIPGKWDPTRGTKLTTYFIGMCVFRFANIYRSWHRQHLRSQPVLQVDWDEEAVGKLEATTMSAHTVLEYKRRVGQIEPGSAQAVLGLRELGFTDAEIAVAHGTSVRSIESTVYRHRQRDRHVA